MNNVLEKIIKTIDIKKDMSEKGCLFIKYPYEYLKNKYGDWIMYEPELDKKTLLLWILPLILFVFGGLLIFKKALINYNKNF